MERLSAHCRREPEICEEDKQILFQYHKLFIDKNWIYKERSETEKIGKKEIQQLLRFIDNNSNLLPSIGGNQTNKKKKGFCLLYLEKWNSIVELLTGLEYPIYNEIELAKIGHLFMKFSNLWDKWQPPYDKIKEKCKYKKRKHFPNINFIFQKIHNLLGIQHFNKYFPIPTTKSSLIKLNNYWYDMCFELKRNNELDYFPSLLKELNEIEQREKIKQTKLNFF